MKKPNKFTVFMGNAIKEAREEEGFSQEDLAKKIYKNRVTLSDIETGKADVDAYTLSLLSANLKRPLSYFYSPHDRENFVLEEIDNLEHELLRHFEAIRGAELKKLAIQIVTSIENFDLVEYVKNHPEAFERWKQIQDLEKNRL